LVTQNFCHLAKLDGVKLHTAAKQNVRLGQQFCLSFLVGQYLFEIPISDDKNQIKGVLIGQFLYCIENGLTLEPPWALSGDAIQVNVA
jgi:hypothetical protein